MVLETAPRVAAATPGAPGWNGPGEYPFRYQGSVIENVEGVVGVEPTTD